MTLKPVIILSTSLPRGLQANFAAILGMSLGRLHPELIGPATPDRDGMLLDGITQVAVPVLGAASEDLASLFAAAENLPVRLAYMRAAFEARNYADYTARIAASPEGSRASGDSCRRAEKGD
ncbi:DUF2000 family protein [Pannonibacter sp. Pt2-lr]